MKCYVKSNKCDLCGKLVEAAMDISGIDFEIGERFDELTGIRKEKQKVNEICLSCHKK